MLVISPQQPCGIGRYSLVSGNSPMRASDPTNHLQCLPQSIKVSPRRDEGIPPYRDKIPFGVYTKKAELLTALLLHFMGNFLFYALLLFFSTHSPHTTVMNMVISISGRVLPSTKSMFIKMR